MAIADVASRLYSSSAYRNTPVIKALADSVKMNLRFRFSLVGMAAALTGSQTLYQIAQQKYLITDEEKKQAKQEIKFKNYVVRSISTLSKQVSLIESIVEKNSLMINAIASDLGYFKRQRKINPMSMNSGMLKSFRVPANSKTVKGKIELINAELAALKGIRIAEADAKQKKVLKETEERSTRYMFFSNLEQMKRQCEMLLDMDQNQIEQILEQGHDWAQDHIAEAKNDMDQVFDFLMNETKGSDHDEYDDMMMEGRKKTGTKLCARGKAAAKARYDVFPSAYSNGHGVQVCKGKIKGLDGKKRCSPPYC